MIWLILNLATGLSRRRRENMFPNAAWPAGSTPGEVATGPRECDGSDIFGQTNAPEVVDSRGISVNQGLHLTWLGEARPEQAVFEQSVFAEQLVARTLRQAPIADESFHVFSFDVCLTLGQHEREVEPPFLPAL